MGGRSATHRRSASGPRGADIGPDGPFLDRYWSESRRPLTILVFLLPLVALYETGLFVLLPEHRGILTNLAHETLLRFFAVFGVTAGLAVPAAALLVVLLVGHLLLRERWRVDPLVLGGMLVESAVLVVPLLVLGQVIARSLPALADGGALDQRIGELDFLGKLTVSLGAGIFEELVFRMLLVAVLHALLVDGDLEEAAWMEGATPWQAPHHSADRSISGSGAGARSGTSTRPGDGRSPESIRSRYSSAAR